MVTKISIIDWGKLSNGTAVHKVILSRGQLKAIFTSYGATLLAIYTPDKVGKVEDVTLQYSGSLNELVKGTCYYGSTIGRVGNRIAKGRFKVDGDDTEYSVVTNNGPNALHGGTVGFDKCVWSFKEITNGICFSHTSPDQDEGYPGTLTVSVNFTLEDDNSLCMLYEASVQEKSTPLNLTNHTYWNLSGNCKSNIFDHHLTLNCDTYLPVDEFQIPKSMIEVECKGTPMDFTGSGNTIGSRLGEVDGCGRRGYDHCYVINTLPEPSSQIAVEEARIRKKIQQFMQSSQVLQSLESNLTDDLHIAAILTEATSGRRMTVSTTAVGVQLYTANWVGVGNSKPPHVPYGALCLETQMFPDAINQQSAVNAILDKKGYQPASLVRTIVLKPGVTFKSLTVHEFFIEIWKE